MEFGTGSAVLSPAVAMKTSQIVLWENDTVAVISIQATNHSVEDDRSRVVEQDRIRAEYLPRMTHKRA